MGFTVAGGFSSQIQLGGDTSGSDVLLTGTDCRIISDIDTLAQQTAYVTLTSKWTAEALNYVQQCYSDNSSGIADCNYYVSQRLPAYVDSAADCPFEASVCKNASSNILLDTGFLSSHEHFGVNAPPEERILMRSMLQCAPLVTEGFTSLEGNYTAYNYGPQLLSSPSVLDNSTYEAESVEQQYVVKKDGQVVEQTYGLR